MNFRQGTKADLSAATAILSAAFRDYPTFRAMLTTNFRQSKRYPRFLRHYFAMEVRAYLKRGVVMVAEQDHQVVGVALVKRPTTVFTTGLFVRSGLLSVLPVGVTQHRLGVLQAIGAIDAALSRGETWVLAYIAVAEDVRGQGVGTGLIETGLMPLMQRQPGKRVTLMTNTARNLAYYQKRGFTVSWTQPIRSADGDVPSWVLGREMPVEK